MTRRDAFLSYAGADRELAERLHGQLEERHGLSVWMDTFDLAPGTPLVSGLARGLDESGALVLLVTERWGQREWTLWESEAFLRDAPRARVVPLLVGVEPSEVPRWVVATPLRLRLDGDALDEDLEVLAAVLEGGDDAAVAARSGEVRRRWRRLRGADPEQAWKVPPEHRAVLADYLRWVDHQADLVQEFADEPYKELETIYVALRSRGIGGGGSGERLEVLVEQLPTGSWTLQGDPGAGKSTALRRLAQLRARVGKERLDEYGALGPAAVPLLVPLPSLAPGGGLATAAAELFVGAQELSEEERGAHRRKALAALRWALDQGRALLLLDGWDEVDPGAAGDLHHRIAAWETHRRDCAFVVASRRFGYRRPSHRFEELELLPLPLEGQRRLLGQYLPEGRVEAVLAEVGTRPSLQAIAGNPFLLTLLAKLAEDPERKLPSRRVALYRESLDRLLPGGGRKRERFTDWPEVRLRRALSELALALVAAGWGPWERAELEARVAQVAGAEGLRQPALDALARDTGLLQPSDGSRRRWTFWHRSLAETLAAEALDRRGPQGAERLVRKLSGRPSAFWRLWEAGEPAPPEELGRWAEVFALHAGMQEDPLPALRRLKGLDADLALRAALGADGVPLEVLLEEFQDRVAGILGLVRELLWAEAPREERARLLLRLARVTRDDDTVRLAAAALLALGEEGVLRELRERVGGAVELGIPERPWAEVPAGTSVLGSSEEERRRFGFDWSREPIRTVHLTRPFRLLATPVTEALFAVVARDAQPEGDLRRPKTEVSWDEAVAFSEGLARLLGRPARLPTEAEWEHACRAGTRTAFWSGDEEEDLARVGWYSASGRRGAQPVAQLPANAWGLHDMHGNVFEWCSDWFAMEVPPESTDPSGPSRGSDRVIRGGAWSGPAGRCRAAYRFDGGPLVRWSGLGFRVLLPPSP